MAGGGNPETAGGAENLKFEVIIEISDPKNPRIDTHEDIYDVVFEYQSDGGRRLCYRRPPSQTYTECY